MDYFWCRSRFFLPYQSSPACEKLFVDTAKWSAGAVLSPYTRIQFSRTKTSLLHKVRKGGSNPAIAVGYLHNFTNNFSLEAGLLWFGASFSLEKSAAAPEATISDIAILDPDPIDSSALVGGIITITVVGIYSFQDNRDGNALTMDYSNVDNRILVTRTLTATYGAIVESPGDPIETTTPTKITHELEAPTSIFIRFVWKFR